MAATEPLPEHVAANREAWDRDAPNWVAPGRRSWSSDSPSWGVWGVPESELRLLPDDLTGWDAIELGCGTGYVSAWLARRGAKPVGIDNSPAQIATAREFQAEFGLDFPILLGNAEVLPFPDASFDLAISEYGASIWADPYAWVPEAARVLRPGGLLVFLVNSALFMLVTPDYEADGPAGERLVRPYFRSHRYTWPDDTVVEFHLPHGEWIRLLREQGFEIERLVEIQAPDGEESDVAHEMATRGWSRRWPVEDVWIARKRA
jgi:SAM-dependent methyltransferase